MNFKNYILGPLLFTSILGFSQKIPHYQTIDSLKRVYTAAPDDQKMFYKTAIDSLRDEARDYADSVIDHMNNSSHFEIESDFASNQMFTGRRGAAAGMVGSPRLMYQHKIGIYISMGMDIYQLKYRQLKLSRQGLRIDTNIKDINKIEPDVIPSIGFQKTFFDKWDLDASLDHTFIFYGQDKNYLATSFNLNNSFDFWTYLTATVNYSILFGGSGKTASYEKKYSNILSFELLHDFKLYRFLGSKVFTISPSCIVDVGNDNFVRNRIKARNINGGLSDQINEALTDNFFGLLNVEAAINIDYRIKNLDVFVDPRLSIPFNVVPANAIAAAPYRTNTTKGPVWYVNVGIKYLFRFWKEKK